MIRRHDKVVILYPQIILRIGYQGKRVDGSQRQMFTEVRPILAGQEELVTHITRTYTGVLHKKYSDKPFPCRFFLENPQSHRILTIAHHFAKSSYFSNLIKKR